MIMTPHPDASPPHPPAVARPAGQARPLGETGLVYRVAATIDEVIAAWRLVYKSYRRSGLIGSNPAGLHTLPVVVGPHTMVAYGRIGPVVTSTLSSYIDSPAGLPLDTAYPDELAQLRQAGRRIAEIGLLADRRASHQRSLNSLFDLMRFGVLYAIHQKMDDVLIGVHPRHTAFYNRLIGFAYAGPEKNYATVNDNAVVLMRLDLTAVPHLPKRPRGLEYFLKHPVAADEFDQRFTFAPALVEGSDIETYLAQQDLTPGA